MSALIAKKILVWFAGNFFIIFVFISCHIIYSTDHLCQEDLKHIHSKRCFYNFRLVAVKERCVKLAIEKCDDSTKKYYLAYIETIKTFINAKCRLIGNFYIFKLPFYHSTINDNIIC